MTRFIASACCYPPGIIDATPRRDEKVLLEPPGPAELAFGAMRRAAQPHAPRLDFLLVAGDYVYLDATAGLFDPAADQAPHRIYADADLRAAKSIQDTNPQARYVLIDDHDIADNWEPSLHPRRNEVLHKTLQKAEQAFRHRHLAPTSPPPPLWRSRRIGSDDWLFLGDTRTQRSARSAQSLDAARIMSPEQSHALCEGLRNAQRTSPSGFRFVATASIFLPRRLATTPHPAAALRSDAWDGYPASQHEVLARIAELGIDHCVFVSGDEHLGCIATARVQRADRGKPAVTLWSVHVGAMYAPYPFANAVKEAFADAGDGWNFEYAGATYRCDVTHTWFPEDHRQPARGEPLGMGDGFAVVEAQSRTTDNAQARLTVAYHYPRDDAPVEWTSEAAHAA